MGISEADPLIIELMLCRIAIMFFFLALHSVGYSQFKKLREYKRSVQFSFAPGISTNGIGSGFYINAYSLNLFGGLSAGNKILEIGIISNLNLKSSTGIQLAGIANVIGSNAFINLTQSEERELIGDGFESNFTGIQLAGALNYVRNTTSGIQVSGGLNVVGGDFKGIQLAAIGNSSAGNMEGLQLAGLYNVAFESVGGFQISSIFNFTNAQLSGIQLGFINKAQRIKGAKSTPPTRERGLQIGFINFCKKMDGVQIGIINFGGDIRGKQIGLINFFNPAGTKDHVRNGTPIGLLNIGSKGSYFRVSYNELFITNIEYTTGNCLNCSFVMGSEMPFDDRNQIFNQNALIVGYDPIRHTWGFGYGFQKVLYNKFTMEPSPLNKTRVINYGLKFMHLNKDLNIDHSFNLLSRLNLDYGKRWRSHYIFVSVSVNYFLFNTDEGYNINSETIATGKAFGMLTNLWPGYGFGVQL
jgi:hypothetical protein